MPILTARNATITFRDGAGTPLTYSFTFDGEYSYNVPGTAKTVHKDRGVLPSSPEITLGEDQEMTASFSGKITALSDAAAENPLDFFNALNGAGFVGSNWTSTISDTDIFTLDVIYTDSVTNLEFEDSSISGSLSESIDGLTFTMNLVVPHPYPTIV